MHLCGAARRELFDASMATSRNSSCQSNLSLNLRVSVSAEVKPFAFVPASKVRLYVLRVEKS